MEKNIHEPKAERVCERKNNHFLKVYKKCKSPIQKEF